VRILVLTGYDDHLPFGFIGERSWKSYAAAHGYGFFCHRDYSPEKGHAAWQKLRIIFDALSPSYDWVFWTDIDSVVTNGSVRLEDLVDPAFPVIVSGDWGPVELSPWSTGHILIRSCGESRKFLLEASKLWQYKNFSTWDQAAMQTLCVGNPLWGQKIKILKPSVLNAVPPEAAPSRDPWKPGHFLAHITGTVPNDCKMPLMLKYEALGLPGRSPGRPEKKD